MATPTTAPPGARRAVPARTDDPTVSVVICAYSDRRWAQLNDAVGSVAAQTRRPLETIVVIDHNAELESRARAAMPGAVVLASAGARGLSGARNTGVAAARGEVVAFLDDDAVADRDWLAGLLAPLDGDDDIVGTGGWVAPRWASGEACAWLPEELLWTVGCSYRGLPGSGARIRNPIGASMALRRAAMIRAGGFREGVGRTGAVPLGCEETELSVRVTRTAGIAGTGSPRFVHAPRARVEHLVEPDRATWRYFRSRCFSEGVSKAIVARHVGGADGLASERGYAARTLPLGVLGGLRDGLRGDRAGFARAWAIVSGLAITTAGYAWGHLKRAGGSELTAGGRPAPGTGEVPS